MRINLPGKHGSNADLIDTEHYTNNANLKATNCAGFLYVQTGSDVYQRIACLSNSGRTSII